MLPCRPDIPPNDPDEKKIYKYHGPIKCAPIPPNTTIYPISAVFCISNGTLFGRQLATGLTAKQAVAVRAVEMLLAVAGPNWAAHELSANSA